jgi:hypothetical protein
VSIPRLVVTILCLALIMVVAVSVAALITHAILAGPMCALATLETATSRELRRELRAR